MEGNDGGCIYAPTVLQSMYKTSKYNVRRDGDAWMISKVHKGNWWRCRQSIHQILLWRSPFVILYLQLVRFYDASKLGVWQNEMFLTKIQRCIKWSYRIFHSHTSLMPYSSHMLLTFNPRLIFLSSTPTQPVVIPGLPFVLQFITSLYPRCPHTHGFQCYEFLYQVAKEHSKSVQATFVNQGNALLVLIIALLHQKIYTIQLNGDWFYYPRALYSSQEN